MSNPNPSLTPLFLSMFDHHLKACSDNSDKGSCEGVNGCVWGTNEECATEQGGGGGGGGGGGDDNTEETCPDQTGQDSCEVQRSSVLATILRARKRLI
jgi:hypothetical protein